VSAGIEILDDDNVQHRGPPRRQPHHARAPSYDSSISREDRERVRLQLLDYALGKANNSLTPHRAEVRRRSPDASCSPCGLHTISLPRRTRVPLAHGRVRRRAASGTTSRRRPHRREQSCSAWSRRPRYTYHRAPLEIRTLRTQARRSRPFVRTAPKHDCLIHRSTLSLARRSALRRRFQLFHPTRRLPTHRWNFAPPSRRRSLSAISSCRRSKRRPTPARRFLLLASAERRRAIVVSATWQPHLRRNPVGPGATRLPLAPGTRRRGARRVCYFQLSPRRHPGAGTQLWAARPTFRAVIISERFDCSMSYVGFISARLRRRSRGRTTASPADTFVDWRVVDYFRIVAY